MPIDDSWEAWEEAVRRSYRASVDTEEEYDAKATDGAVTKVAYYMRGLNFDTELLDDTSFEEPNTTVQLLLDFLAFTNSLSIEQMRQFYTYEAMATMRERFIEDE